MSIEPVVLVGAHDGAPRSALEAALGLSTPLNTNIHDSDQMFTYVASVRGSESIARSAYFTTGVQLLQTLEQLVGWKCGSFENIGALLDFASGYGRLTRFLVHKMPAARIWVSDIQADAVAFQQAEFGVNGIVSTTDPTDLPCDRTFDCIFVASLFSHLPGTTFTPWLTKLYSLLSPGGLLIFSVNDERRLHSGGTMPDTGIWYGGASEVASLDARDYGTTVVSEAYVREAIVAATGRPTYHRIPYGLSYAQDLYILVNEPTPDFSGLHFTYLPHGDVDRALWTRDSTLLLQGWAADFSEGPSAFKVQFLSGDRLVGECTPSMPRPDVQAFYKHDRFALCGWETTLRMPEADLAQPLVVKAVPESGVESLLYVGDVASLFPRGKVESCWWTGPEVLHLTGWAVDATGEGAPVEVQVYVEGTLRQKCMPYIPRPELQEHFMDDRFLDAGWECDVRIPDYKPSLNLIVRTVSCGGVESTLYTGGIATLEGQAGTNHDTWHDELVQRLAYIRHLEAEIARKNAALAEWESRARRWPWQRVT